MRDATIGELDVGKWVGSEIIQFSFVLGRLSIMLQLSQVLSCLFKYRDHPGIKLVVVLRLWCTTGKDNLVEFSQTMDKRLAVIGEVDIHGSENAVQYLPAFRLRQFFGVCVVPLLILGNDPAFHLALLIQTIIVYADPEKHPEEGLQIVHEAMRVAKKRPNGHEDLGASLAWCTGSLIITCLVGKVEIDEETAIFVLCEHHVANRYITVEDPSIQ